MKAEQLWASILQEAIQGKLVPQLESEPEVDQIGNVPDDVPFDIPAKWRWIYFSDLVDFSLGKTPERANNQYWGKDVPWVSIADITQSKGSITNTKEAITNKALSGCFNSKLVPKGTLLMSFKLSIGKVAITDIDCVHNEAIVSIFPKSEPNHDNTTRDYLFYVLPLLITYVETTGAIKGATLNKRKLSVIPIPVPPCSEQRRIVNMLKKIWPLVCDYGKSEEKFTKLNSKISEKLRLSILQEAIQGKLVPQLESEPEVETFSSEPDDPPFDIPDKWKWAKFRDVIDVRDGTHDTPKYQISGVPLVTSKNLRNGTIDFNNVKYISEEDHIEISKRSKVEKGDILFAMIGTVGNPAIVGNDSIFSIKNVALFKPLYDSKLNFEFLYYLLLFAQNQMIKESSGGVQRFVSLKYLRNFYIPVPPLGEQQRIVSRIKKLISTLEAL